MNHADIFCDGSCLDNGRPSARGGWSCVIVGPLSKTPIEKLGKLRAGVQTNNRAEMEAMLQALLFIEQEGDENTFYKIYSDSDVAVQGITGEAARNANRDIWEQIEELCTRLIGRFTVVGIKNDKSNNEDYLFAMNNLSDKLARQGANSLLLSPTEVTI